MSNPRTAGIASFLRRYYSEHKRVSAGGEEELYGLYCLWTQVSEAKQQEICGCTMTQVKFMLSAVSTLKLEDSDETLSRLVKCLDLLERLGKQKF